MPLIVDTFNVLHMTGVLPPDLSGMGVEELRGVITLSRFRHQAIQLVCDGVEPIEFRRRRAGEGGIGRNDEFAWNRGFDNISLRWSGTKTDADSVIEILVAQNSAPRRLTVVTSDRRLGREVRRRRARVMPSESFLERLSDDFRTNVERSSSSSGSNATARPPMAYDVPLHRESVRWWLKYLGMDPDRPMVEGNLIAPSPVKRVVEEGRSERGPEEFEIDADPIRWWLRYFGLDPDRLPEDLLVEATVEGGGDREAVETGGAPSMSRERMSWSSDDSAIDDEVISIDDIDPEAWL